MPLNCGIVGLPNVGKSTIFSALTSAPAEAANYPFCTIDPNVGIVNIPDKRLDKIIAIAPLDTEHSVICRTFFNPCNFYNFMCFFIDMEGHLAPHPTIGTHAIHLF